MSTEPKPDSPPLSPQTMSFSYMGMTGLNSLGTKDGEHYTLYLPTTTTLSGWSASRPKGAHSAIGAGVYSGTLDAEDKQLLEAMRGKLCRDLKWPAMRSPEYMFSYYMQCDGKVYTNSVDLSAGFPQGTEGMMSTFGELMDHFYAKATRTPVKLDVDYEVTLQRAEPCEVYRCLARTIAEVSRLADPH
ncbi:hypothetical protein [Lysobacter sp. FW306-1B-D06B]|uniref:hypothetical protein n=1 Tax=Lysobacter sp. FW306-1B-D06B TaxID=3140250 RepID=UPI0031403E8F